MPSRPSRPPQQEERPSNQLAAIQAKQTEVVHAFNSDAKINLLRGLLGGDVVLFERFRAVALHTIARNNDILLKCTVESIFDALRQAAEVKLEVSGILGEGYLIEYRNQATFQAGYRGLMKLSRRSGLVDAIDAHMVYEKDEFDVRLGTDPAIIHNPDPFGDRGKYIGVYAWSRLRTGELIIEPMSLPEIEKVRGASKNPDGEYSPWRNWFGEMARKSALKRLMKRLPLGEDAESLLRYEAHYENEVAEDQQRPADDRLRRSVLAALPGGQSPETPTGSGEQPDGQKNTPGAAGRAPEAQHPCRAVDESGAPCVREAHGDDVNHRNEAGETWADAVFTGDVIPGAGQGQREATGDHP